MEAPFFTVRSVADCVQSLSREAMLGTEERSFKDACGYVLAEDVYAKDTIPMATRSCMDGYALCSRDTLGSTQTSPSYVECIGSIAIDSPVTQTVYSGECMEIVTGALLPPGTDAVVMVEHTQKIGKNTISIHMASTPNEHCMLAGEDATVGEIVLHKGTKIRPQEVAMLATLGICSVQVYKKPVVAIFSTGDEIIPPEETLRPGTVRDANAYTIGAWVQSLGCEVVYLPIVPDNKDMLHSAIMDAIAIANITILSGGSSIGARDFTISAIESVEGATVLAHGIAMHPGKPTVLASVPSKDTGGKSYIIGLPGQVTSAYCVLFSLVVPFVQYLAGDKYAFLREHWNHVRAVLQRNISGVAGREVWVRVHLSLENGIYTAVPIFGKSGLLRTMLEANGIIVIPDTKEGLEKGTEVYVYTM